MRAIVITRPGGPEVLQERIVPDPEPGPGEIRVRVLAAGVNRADLLQRRGAYPAPAGWPSDIPGLEYAGTVESVGPDASRWLPGDRVMGLVGGGAYAELVVVDERAAVAAPERLSPAEAAAVPEAFVTAHDALFTQVDLRAGETVLIHAVGSGVGTAALQLAKAAGAAVFGTQRSEWKLDRARDLGLDVAIPGGAEDFADAVLRETAGGGVDAILDLVGGGYLAGNIRSLAPRGRLIVVGLVAGRRAELDLDRVLTRRLHIMGTVLRSRSEAEKIEATRAFADSVLPLLESGVVRPIIDTVYPMTEAAEAHREMEENRNFGKIVLEW
ncbi:MAG TPA: NAD(P)H-quinone oxidoreductase [Longimicrobiales bacterium]|nr:NAD(P)H-quinone oxidoreductase [Longimicrobiales bacterium]